MLKKILGIAVISTTLFSCGGDVETPESVVEKFLNELSEGNCDAAEALCTGDAVLMLEGTKLAGCPTFTNKIKSTKCEVKEEYATCTCIQESGAHPASLENTYKLKLTDGHWIIKSFTGGNTPETVSEAFVYALGDGNCDKAMEMSIETAQESVQASIDAGCEKYATKIKSTTCEIENSEASCTCVEKRGDMEMTFIYDLKLSDGSWMVNDYKKDMGMDVDM